jgi:hypothetical protein
MVQAVLGLINVMKTLFMKKIQLQHPIPIDVHINLHNNIEGA